MATAAKFTIAEVEEIVGTESSIRSHHYAFHMLSIVSFRPRGSDMPKARLTEEQIAERVPLELPDGAYVNLGWGIPNLIAFTFLRK